MKLLNKLILIGLLQLCLVVSVKAQDAGNFSAIALDFSRTYIGGSARMQGLGGAQTALGGDISSASSNPAGLGFFNRSEFSFSPTINFINTSSDYLGTSTEDSRVNFNFANLGVVLNKSKGDLVESKWRGGSFGISLNRIASFQNQVTYEGNTFFPQDVLDDPEKFEDPNRPNYDFLDYAVLYAGLDNGGNIAFPDDLNYTIDDGAELADIIGLIQTQEDADGTYIERNIYDADNPDFFAYPTKELPTRQTETIVGKGGIYQTSLSYGGNYDDKIYFGAGAGILSVDTEVERTFIEYPTRADLTALTLTDNYSISGVGVNATFGLIYRPINTILLGLSYETPSYYSLNQDRELVLNAKFSDNETPYEHGFIYDQFTYTLTTPSRLSGGLTYFFGKNGFITGDMERVNYAGANLSNGSDGYDFIEQIDEDSYIDYNNNINDFKSVFNYRVGVEYRFDMFRIRGGYAYMGDPTDDDVDERNSRVSFGAGIRKKDFFVDLGVIHSLGTESLISPYPGARNAKVTNENTAGTVTVGWFF